MKRNTTLDILKGICLIFVVVTHYPFSDETRLKFLFDFWVTMAIPVCMLVTGYVYSLSFQRKNIGTLSDAYSQRSGNIEHLIRYTVPFFIAWIIELIGFRVFSVREPLSLLGYIKEFVCGGDGPGSYYYPVIVQIVFLFPLIYFCIKRRSTKGLIICCTLNVVFEFLQWAYGLNPNTYRLLSLRYILLISFGCYFGLGGKLSKLAAACLFIIGVVSVYLNTYKGVSLFFITSWRSTSFLTSLLAVPVFYHLIKLELSCKPLELLGKASYNIFLVQMVFFRFGVRHVISMFVSNPILHFVLCLMVCLVGGVVFYLVETPITKACIGAYKKWILKRNLLQQNNTMQSFEYVS